MQLSISDPAHRSPRLFRDRRYHGGTAPVSPASRSVFNTSTFASSLLAAFLLLACDSPDNANTSGAANGSGGPSGAGAHSGAGGAGGAASNGGAGGTLGAGGAGGAGGSPGSGEGEHMFSGITPTSYLW